MPNKSLIYDISTEVRFFGRTYERNGEYFFNWSASGFTFSFIGSGAYATFTSNVPEQNQAYIKIYVDGVETSVVKLTDRQNTVTLAEGLDPQKKHTVKVLKRSNARSSSAALTNLELFDGEKLMPEPAKKRLIEFIGDSLTVGYATVAYDATKWSTDTEDPTRTYAEQVASEFDADYFIVAISGRGVARNTGGDTDKTLPKIYPFIDQYNLPDVPYEFKTQPDVIVVNLGTNDSSRANALLTPEEFSEELKSFLQSVRKYNPDARIVYGYGMTSQKLVKTIQTTVELLQSEGDDKISFIAYPKAPKELIAFGHPTAPAYIPWGEQLIEEIKRVTGW
ncbi:MAG: hypothetical protein IKA82_00960 [Clostridia bacterium]|nr:hypothetical protein [Clostridia bacterium]